MSDKMKLNEELTIEAYPFSDFITCIEVNLNGKSYQSFCTLRAQVDEWKDDTDLLEAICYEHIKNSTGSIISKQRLVLASGLEAEIYPFSDYIHCVDIYHKDQLIQSFCCDTNTFTEYQDDMETMISMYSNIS